MVYIDRGLLPMTVVDRDAVEFGKHPTIVAFSGNKVSVRRGDGSLLSHAVSPYPSALHGYAAGNRSMSQTMALLKWANPGLFFVYFRSFQTPILHKKTVGFSAIQTRIVGIESEHGDHLTTTTAQPWNS